MQNTIFFFFSSRRRHTRWPRDWSSDVCSSDLEPAKPLSNFTTRLTDEQLEALRACARGVSLRFEKPEIVNALVSGGYVERNVAGVITVMAKGHQYLRTHER